MDGAMSKPKSLNGKALTQFIVCVVVLLLLSAPLFYWLTKNFYAEDMIDLMEAVRQGRPEPVPDIEQDIMQGVMLQYALIATVLGIAMVLTANFISKRLWKPFDRTLEVVEDFKLENAMTPQFPDTDTAEFVRLNEALKKLMENSTRSYRLQKEFTENASHELQTPLAVFQSRLDLLLQFPEVTERQAAIIQDLYQMTSRLSRLNRNLLLLAKMENNQFKRAETVDVVALVRSLRGYMENLAEGLLPEIDFQVERLEIKANRSLLESMVNNLVVNAVRHNKPGGRVGMVVMRDELSVYNTSDEPALDGRALFSRFYRTSEKVEGNGLGLAIVKAVCDYHGWKITYGYAGGVHRFRVVFVASCR